MTSVLKALSEGLKLRFTDRWEAAYSPENIDDDDYRGDRLALLSAAFDPQTWCLELHLSQVLSDRVKAHLKSIFLEEYRRQTALVAAVAPARDSGKYSSVLFYYKC